MDYCLTAPSAWFGLPIGQTSHRHAMSGRPTDVAAPATSLPAVGLIQLHIESAEGPVLGLTRSMRSSSHSLLSRAEFKDA